MNTNAPEFYAAMRQSLLDAAPGTICQSWIALIDREQLKDQASVKKLLEVLRKRHERELSEIEYEKEEAEEKLDEAEGEIRDLHWELESAKDMRPLPNFNINLLNPDTLEGSKRIELAIEMAERCTWQQMEALNELTKSYEGKLEDKLKIA